jgi:DNA-binding GntR family transcriptional regulator
VINQPEPAVDADVAILRGESLRLQATRAIRAAIVTGGLETGRVHSARALSAKFGVSATPVREAMLDLVSEGLMVAVPNKGFRVVDLSDHDLDEIFQLRLLLEIPPIGRLAGRLTRSDAENLARLVAEIQKFAQNGDLTGFIASDRQFHLELLELYGNHRLVELVGHLRDQSRLYGLRNLVSGGSLIASADEHADILKALDSGDKRAAESFMRLHLGHTRGLWAGLPESQT